MSPPHTSFSTCQHFTQPKQHRRSAKGSPPRTNKWQVGSSLVLGYQRWGCRGEVSITTCNEIRRVHLHRGCRCLSPRNEVTSGACRLILQRGKTKASKVVQDKAMSVSVCRRLQDLIVQTVSQTAWSHLRVMQLACRGATLTDHERQRRIRRSMAATDEFQTLNTCPTLEKWKRAAEQIASSLGFHHNTLFPKDSQIDGLIYFQHYRYSRLSMNYAPITALVTHFLTVTLATKEGRFAVLN